MNRIEMQTDKQFQINLNWKICDKGQVQCHKECNKE
jgi:hypothetical protein